MSFKGESSKDPAVAALQMDTFVSPSEVSCREAQQPPFPGAVFPTWTAYPQRSYANLSRILELQEFAAT